MNAILESTEIIGYEDFYARLSANKNCLSGIDELLNSVHKSFRVIVEDVESRTSDRSFHVITDDQDALLSFLVIFFGIHIKILS